MQSTLQTVELALALVWQASRQAACLAVLVAALVSVFGARLAARWRFVLWSLVFVRLALPIVPASPTSAFRWLPTARIAASSAPTETRNVSPSSGVGQDDGLTFRAPTPTAGVSERPAVTADQSDGDTNLLTVPPSWTWRQAITAAWLLGVIAFGIRLIGQRLALARRAKHWPPTHDARIKALLAACCRRLAIRSPVVVLVSEDETGPAVTGLLRPRIVVPSAVLHDFSASELEIIFLHELAHIRRGDLWIQQAISLVRAVHWFNPAAWWALNRMQVEREMACDALVLDALGSAARQAYGSILLQIVERASASSLSPGLLGTFDTAARLRRRLAVIRDYRGSSRKATSLAVATISVAAALGLTSPPATSQDDVATQPAAESGADRQDSAASKLLARLDELRAEAGRDAWARTLRDLVQLGPAAVPDLIAEMDATDDEFRLRALAFAMRAIGDKRAVPALIRALPKTCVAHPVNDYGFTVADPELLAFLQKHDKDEPNDKMLYSFGRAVNEVRFTLQQMTGTRHGEDELVFVNLEGTPRQQAYQRQLYQRCAERWATWWETHWKELVDDQHFSAVNLQSLADEPLVQTGFPHGPKIKIDTRHKNWLLESVRNPESTVVFYDFDSGRKGGLPDHLRALEGQPERLDNILAWAAREGFDVMGSEYTAPGSDKPCYVLRGLGLSAWQIDTDRWKRLEAELREGTPVKMGTRTDGLLAAFDTSSGEYRPQETATFLFQTREGGYGAMFVGVEVHDDNLRPGGLIPDDSELSPIASKKGRRFAYFLLAGDAAAKDTATDDAPQNPFK